MCDGEVIDDVESRRADEYTVPRSAVKVTMPLDFAIVLTGRMFEDDTDPIARSEEGEPSKLDSP